MIIAFKTGPRNQSYLENKVVIFRYNVTPDINKYLSMLINRDINRILRKLNLNLFLIHIIIRLGNTKAPYISFFPGVIKERFIKDFLEKANNNQ